MPYQGSACVCPRPPQVLYGYLVPISLYVSVEVVRIITALVFINLDVSMYDPVSNQPCQARTSNLNEELGMVEIVLSDKTGTLTQNQVSGGRESERGAAAARCDGDWSPRLSRCVLDCSFPRGSRLNRRRWSSSNAPSPG